jgi:hypothetical protein
MDDRRMEGGQSRPTVYKDLNMTPLHCDNSHEKCW